MANNYLQGRGHIEIVGEFIWKKQSYYILFSYAIMLNISVLFFFRFVIEQYEIINYTATNL